MIAEGRQDLFEPKDKKAKKSKSKRQVKRKSKAAKEEVDEEEEWEEEEEDDDGFWDARVPVDDKIDSPSMKMKKER